MEVANTQGKKKLVCCIILQGIIGKPLSVYALERVNKRRPVAFLRSVIHYGTCILLVRVNRVFV